MSLGICGYMQVIFMRHFTHLCNPKLQHVHSGNHQIVSSIEATHLSTR